MAFRHVRPKINMAELSELVELWKSTAYPCRKLEIENCQEKDVVLFSSQERGISRYNVSVKEQVQICQRTPLFYPLTTDKLHAIGIGLAPKS